jgi:hypothetical protein
LGGYILQCPRKKENMKISFKAWLKSFSIGALLIIIGSFLMIIWSSVIINPLVVCRLFIYNPIIYINVGLLYALNNNKLEINNYLFERNNALGGGVTSLCVGFLGFLIDTAIMIYNNYWIAKYANYSMGEAIEKLPFLNIEIIMVFCYFIFIFIGSIIGGISAFIYSKRLKNNRSS